MKRAGLWGAVLSLAMVQIASAQALQVAQNRSESPRSSMLEVKLGSYLPMIDSESGLTGTPYATTFDGAMLLLEVQGEAQFYQGFGTASVGLSVGYAEKFARATQLLPGGGTAPSADSTGIRVVPVRLLAVYRFDVAANEWGVPLVPYVKAGLVGIPYWLLKSGDVEEFAGERGSGIRVGYQATLGMSLQLDFLDRRFARDFDSGLGVNHSYLFAEYTWANVDNFGTGGLVLSHRGWFFGLGLEY